MFIAILILLILPFTDTSKIKGSSYKPFYTIAFWIFVLNFLVLMWLGSCHVEPPFIVAGQIATAYYFSHFLIILPVLGILDNALSLLSISWNPVFNNIHDINNKEDIKEDIKSSDDIKSKENIINLEEVFIESEWKLTTWS
jgi:Cytochrome b(C-terminal)/b6/petD